MKILIVDDENDIRRIARLSLGRVGQMEVVEASSGTEGVEKALAEKPDAILLDVSMPGMDGRATFAALQANPETKSIPVVFLTAKTMPSEVQALKSLGASGVLAKPFNPMTLASEVTAVLGK